VDVKVIQVAELYSILSFYQQFATGSSKEALKPSGVFKI
jgi:hypothetical protein